MKRIFSILFVIIIYYNGKSQVADSTSFYKNFDEYVNLKNTLLSYGVLFKEQYISSKTNHVYFDENRFRKGSINYRDQFYPNIDIKYDIIHDKVIIKTNQDIAPTVKTSLKYVLKNELIKYFYINDIKFINTKTKGFLRVLEENKHISLLKKHKKHKKQKEKNYRVHFIFKEYISYYLNYKNEYFPIDSKKDFFKIFPDFKKEINKFYSKNKELRKKNLEKFTITLCNTLDEMLTHKSEL